MVSPPFATNPITAAPIPNLMMNLIFFISPTTRRITPITPIISIIPGVKPATAIYVPPFFPLFCPETMHTSYANTFANQISHLQRANLCHSFTCSIR